MDPYDREFLIIELSILNNPSTCRSHDEWTIVRARIKEICALLNVDHPEDVL